MQDIRSTTKNNLRKGTVRKLILTWPLWTETDRSEYCRLHTTHGRRFDIEYLQSQSLGCWCTLHHQYGCTECKPDVGWRWNSDFPAEYRSTVEILLRTSANIWLAADGLAKLFYSTIMTDFGQVTVRPNILLNATALQYFSQNFTAMGKKVLSTYASPASDSYEALKEQTGPLNTSASVISSAGRVSPSRW